MAEPREPRFSAAPAIAIWIAGSLVAVVLFALVFALERGVGWGHAAISEHDSTAVLPHAGWTAAATLAALVGQAYLTSFYVKSVAPVSGARWLKFSAAGAIVASVIAYVNGERQLAFIREYGIRAMLDPERTDANLIALLAGAAVFGVAQAIALRATSRRFLAWPFVSVAAFGLGALLLRSLRPLALGPAVSIVLAAAVIGVALGASFAVLVRPRPS